jgi:hypothetical protein
MLMLHIIIALISVGMTTYVFFNPSRGVLRGAYALMGATLATGTVLIMSNPAHMVQACLTGIIYTAGVSYGLVMTQRKLAAQTVKK